MKNFIESANKFNLRGCNGFDGDEWGLISEHRVSRTGSVREKLLFKIKANEDYALAA